MDYGKVYIDGVWTSSKSGEFFEVENPATLEVISSVPKCNEEDVNLAVESSLKAFDDWSRSSISERIDILNKVKQYLQETADELADVIVRELGTTYDYSNRVHVHSGIKLIEEYIDIVKDYEFEYEIDGSLIVREPFGVVCALCPWNYPLLQIVQKVVPAILAGNTVVLKPSKVTPLSAYYLVEAFHKAGLPKGVLNMLTGSGNEIGERIAKHKDVSVVSFTGSKEVGEKMYSCAKNGIKKLILELGGKSASVLLEGGDIRKCVKSVLGMVYYNAGQTCSALTRLVIPEKHKEEVEKIILEETLKYKVGSPFDSGNRMGPLSSKKQYEKVNHYIDEGIKGGARVLILDEKDYGKGYFVGPVVFTDVKNDMKIAREEIFGPVLCVITYSDEKEALQIANDNEYGLSGAVFGEEKEAVEFARRMRTGTVKINGAYKDGMPFGGYKASGIGREGSVYGFEEYLDIKVIMI